MLKMVGAGTAAPGGFCASVDEILPENIPGFRFHFF